MKFYLFFSDWIYKPANKRIVLQNSERFIRKYNPEVSPVSYIDFDKVKG